MPYAINIKAANATAAKIEALWDQVAVYEDSPSMAALSYAPHITLAIYDQIEGERVVRALHDVFSGEPSVRLRFERLSVFEDPDFVLWADPEPKPELLQLHLALHRHVDPGLCRPHYRPGAWVPHCTLAMNLRREAKAEVLRFAAQARPAIDVLFDLADFVQFHPVEVLDECGLGASGEGAWPGGAEEA